MKVRHEECLLSFQNLLISVCHISAGVDDGRAGTAHVLVLPLPLQHVAATRSQRYLHLGPTSRDGPDRQ